MNLQIYRSHLGEKYHYFWFWNFGTAQDLKNKNDETASFALCLKSRISANGYLKTVILHWDIKKSINGVR